MAGKAAGNIVTGIVVTGAGVVSGAGGGAMTVGTRGAALLTGVPEAAVVASGALIAQGYGSIQAGVASLNAAMSGSGSGSGGPAAAPAPPINRQKQAGHIEGTPQHTNRVASGKMTSTFLDPKKADALTQEAWAKGTPIGSNGDLRLYDFGTPIATGPGGGGYQTQIRVSMDAKGQVHGSPWRRVFEGPLPQ
ncbi:hypothetical protein WME99_22325 [Sorangium sp. So ce136]|uniref:hypothetical protein n=1 Tax=Sorangium sp. So ce136 TaxID=3133284 RepID=UPI003F068874